MVVLRQLFETLPLQLAVALLVRQRQGADADNAPALVALVEVLLFVAGFVAVLASPGTHRAPLHPQLPPPEPKIGPGKISGPHPQNAPGKKWVPPGALPQNWNFASPCVRINWTSGFPRLARAENLIERFWRHSCLWHECPRVDLGMDRLAAEHLGMRCSSPGPTLTRSEIGPVYLIMEGSPVGAS